MKKQSGFLRKTRTGLEAVKKYDFSRLSHEQKKTPWTSTGEFKEAKIS